MGSAKPRRTRGTLAVAVFALVLVAVGGAVSIALANVPAVVRSLRGHHATPRAAAPGATASRATGPLYLSLGDSLAAGMQPDARGIDRITDAGYADDVVRRLRRVEPGLQLRKLSCGGFTTSSLLHGGAGCAPHGADSQVVVAERLLRTARVRLVTVDIGDNDVERCVHFDGRGVDEACVDRGMATLRANLPTIAQRLRAAAGPGVPIVGILDYDQFLALWRDGPAGRATARRTLGVIGAMNDAMRSIYQSNGVLVADASVRFRTTDLRTPSRLPDGTPAPLAVARICRWTWSCSGPPVNHDDHANAAGYGQIAQSVLDALAAGAGGTKK